MHYVIFTVHPQSFRCERNLELRQSSLPIGPHSLPESTNHADGKTQRRLPYSLRGVDGLLLCPCPAQQGDSKLLWHVGQSGNLVLSQVPEPLDEN